MFPVRQDKMGLKIMGSLAVIPVLRFVILMEFYQQQVQQYFTLL
jgi:hypothetical protein